MKWVRVFSWAAVTLVSGAVAGAQAQSSTFEARPMTDGGGANIANAYGGVYVYRALVPADGRLPSRALLGERTRTEFSLFSAEEEDALWHLRDRLLHPAPPPAPRKHLAPRRSALDDPALWPKVVVTGTKTCVPELAFSESPDWREHLVCWSTEARRVE